MQEFLLTKRGLYDRPPLVLFFFDRVALVKQGDNGIGSVRPSVRLFVCLFVCAAIDIRGSALLSAAKSSKSHYQSKFSVCVSAIRGVCGLLRGCGRSAFNFLSVIDSICCQYKSALLEYLQLITYSYMNITIKR